MLLSYMYELMFTDTIVPEPDDSHYINEICSAYGVPVEDIPHMLSSTLEPFIAALPQERGNLQVSRGS